MKREGYRTLYQLSETNSDGGTGLAPSEELLFLSSVSFLSRTVFLSGQNRPRCPHPCTTGQLPDAFYNRKKRWIDITGLIKFHAGMVEFCWTSFTIIFCSRRDPTEIHVGQLYFEQGKKWDKNKHYIDVSNTVPSSIYLLFLISADLFQIFRGNNFLKIVLNCFHKGRNLVPT